MGQVALSVLIVIAGALISIGIGCLYLKRVADRYPSVAGEKLPYGLVVAHLFLPKNGLPHPRGQLVAQTAFLWANAQHCPLLFTAGQSTSAIPTEADIYRVDLAIRCSVRLDLVELITGQDASVRDTSGEVREALRIARQRGVRRIRVVGARPHLGRIVFHWRKLNTNGIAVEFAGVHVPASHYLWELLMLFLEPLFPPGSLRRQLLFDRTGRKSS